MIDIKKIEDEYRPTSGDDDYFLTLKTAIFEELTEVERRLFITYCEIGSYAGLARFYHNSTPTARKRIKEIKAKLKAYV